MAVHIYQPYIHSQTSAASVWTITHGLGRDVSVDIYDESANKINADVEKLSNTQLRIKFFEKGDPKAMKGVAVIG